MIEYLVDVLRRPEVMRRPSTVRSTLKGYREKVCVDCGTSFKPSGGQQRRCVGCRPKSAPLGINTCTNCGAEYKARSSTHRRCEQCRLIPRWKFKNKENVKASSKRSYERHREEKKAKAAAYRAAHYDRVRASTKAWKEAHYEEVQAQRERYRRRKGMRRRRSQRHDAHVKAYLNQAIELRRLERVAMLERMSPGDRRRYERWQYNMLTTRLSDGYVAKRLRKNAPELKGVEIPLDLIAAERVRLVIVRELRQGKRK